jgi:hypothetical protein
VEEVAPGTHQGINQARLGELREGVVCVPRPPSAPNQPHRLQGTALTRGSAAAQPVRTAFQAPGAARTPQMLLAGTPKSRHRISYALALDEVSGMHNPGLITAGFGPRSRLLARSSDP